MLGEVLAEVLQAVGFLPQGGGSRFHVGQRLPHVVRRLGAGHTVDTLFDRGRHVGSQLVGNGPLEPLQAQRLVAQFGRPPADLGQGGGDLAVAVLGKVAQYRLLPGETAGEDTQLVSEAVEGGLMANVTKSLPAGIRQLVTAGSTG